MPMMRLLRSAVTCTVVSGVLALGGCIAAPVQLPPGAIVLSQHCDAGFYQCTLPEANQIGTPCSCPGLGAPSYGSVR